MGHWCRICGATRPSERFSGKGHRDHICKECSAKPKQAIAAIDQKAEIFGYLKQSHITSRNLARLRVLAGSENTEVAKQAGIVLEVAQVRPYKKRRLKVLARGRRDQPFQGVNLLKLQRNQNLATRKR